MRRWQSMSSPIGSAKVLSGLAPIIMGICFPSLPFCRSVYKEKQLHPIDVYAGQTAISTEPCALVGEAWQQAG